MHKLEGKKSYFAIKVDLANTYDMVNLSFIESVLVEVGIHDKVRGIIIELCLDDAQ